MSKLNGKVAIVTGASKGIGAGIALELANQGASVVVNYSSSRAEADNLVAKIVDKGGKAIAVQGDMTKTADVARLFEKTKESFGKLDILVNNAGVFKFEPFDTLTEESFHYHYNVNVMGPILTTLEALKHFAPAGGSIINISSIVGSHPQSTMSMYASSKAAIDNLTRGLALELGGKNIRVNAVAPGYTETEGVQTKGYLDENTKKNARGAVPTQSYRAAKGHRASGRVPGLG